MAARLIHMKCQNCGANLELDLDHLMAYCPYCGEKLMIDFDGLNSVLIEKEKTNRTSRIVNGVENIADKVVSYKVKKEEIKSESEKITKEKIIFFIVVMLFFLIMYLTTKF